MARFFPQIKIPTTCLHGGPGKGLFLNAKNLGYTGTELQDAIHQQRPATLARFEAIRAHSALQMETANGKSPRP